MGYSLWAIPYQVFPYWLFPVSCSLLAIPYCLLPVGYALVFIPYWVFPYRLFLIGYCLLVIP